MKLSSIFEPQLVLTPWVQKMSLCAMGIPVSGPAAPERNRYAYRAESFADGRFEILIWELPAG